MDTVAAPASAKAVVKKTPKKKSPAKPKKPLNHPKYSDMIQKAIASLKERGGSSRQAILKYICANFKVDAELAKNHLKLSLRAGVKNGTLKQSKGTGASGSFRLGDKVDKKPKATKAKKAAAKPKVTKPKTKKVTKPKAAVVKKSPKKAKSPKKTKAKKPAAEKKPKAAKPKAAKKAKKPKSPKKAKTAKK